MGLTVVPDDLDRASLGCWHLPSRYEGLWLDGFDVSVGRAAETAHRATTAIVAAEITHLLLSGPPGCGKSHLAAAAANAGAEPLQREWHSRIDAARAVGDKCVDDDEIRPSTDEGKRLR